MIGNVCKDPEIHTTQSGIKRANFTLAVNRRYANANGTKEVDFIQVVAWRQTAEFVEKYVTKGKKLAIEGELQVRKFEGQDGQKRTISEVVISELEFVSPKAGEAGESKAEDAPVTMEEAPNEVLPF